MVKIDDTDKKILELLEQNSRMHYTEIAEKLDVSEATVRNRVRCMEENDIIKKYTIDINPRDIGYNIVTMLGIDVEPQNLLEAVGKIREVDQVRWAAKSSGDHMIMAELWTENAEELSEIISEKIGKIEGVRDMKPAILLEKKDKKNNVYK
ncbi:MAG: Lrp/AsnC family transcriptional regulator [Thermoplasmatota archaeon]